MTACSPLHRTELSEANDKLLAVQECYISVCREKDTLEERIHTSEQREEQLVKEKEVGVREVSVHCQQPLQIRFQSSLGTSFGSY